MRYEPVASSFFCSNRQRLGAQLEPSSIVVLQSNDIYPTNADGVMRFHQNANLYYLSGIDQEDTSLVLFPDAADEKDRAVLYVRETTEKLKIWEGAKLTIAEAKELSGIATVKHTTEFSADLHRLALQAKNIYLESNEHARADLAVQTRNDRLIRECQERFPLHRLERLAPLMAQLRAIKADEEIAMMRKAIEITHAGYERVLKAVKPGIGEWELEAEFSHEFIRQKSRGFAYAPIIASGASSNCLHYVENDKICQDGDLLLMDIGAEWGYWNADLTRTIPVNGKFSERQRAVYDAVLRTFHFANRQLRPGILLKDYNQKVCDFMAEELAALGLLTADEIKDRTPEKDPVRKFFMHGTSHHLGLDVHDVSPFNQALEVGMVFTIEPGIYIADEGFGIRLENDFYIGEDSNIDLCEGVPLEADEIEAAMA
ncbi:MAG: aminopeptidase P family protein [Verrucomicrobiota bacterium]